MYKDKENRFIKQFVSWSNGNLNKEISYVENELIEKTQPVDEDEHCKDMKLRVAKHKGKK